MNVDFRIMRRRARGVCGLALAGSLFGGCISLHKPRFWDKDDVTTTSTTPSGSGSQASTKPATDSADSAKTDAKTKAQPTVVAADHSTSDDSSGHISVFDFTEPGSTAPTKTNPPATDSLPAPPTNSQVSSSSDDPFGTVPAQTPTTGGTTNTPPAARIANNTATATAKELDPFADAARTAAPADVTVKTPRAAAAAPVKLAQGADPFSDLGGPAPADVRTPRAQPEAQPVAKPAPAPIQTDVLDPPSALPQPPAAPQPATSSAPASPFAEETRPATTRSQPAASPPTQPPAPVAEMPADPQPAVQIRKAPVAPVKQAPSVADDAFADPAPIKRSQPRQQPAVSMGVAPSDPSCAAPANKVTNDSPIETPAAVAAEVAAARPAEIAVAATAPVPASRTRVSSTNASDASSESVHPVNRYISRRVVSKIEPVPAAEESATQHIEVSKQVEQAPAPKASAPVSERSATSNPMICDSNAVRGRFTGAEGAGAKPLHQAPPKENETKPAPAGVPTSSNDGETALPRQEEIRERPARPSHAPKPLSGVVNADAHAIGRPSVADPFMLEQTADTSPVDAVAVEPVNVGESRAAVVNAHQEQPSAGPTHDRNESATLIAADLSVAPSPAREAKPFRSETWFGVGIGVGLAASFALWFRSRPRSERVHG